MTVLPQLQRDLFNAAEERLRPDATAPHERSRSLASSFRARRKPARAGLPVILSVAVAIGVVVIAVGVLGRGHQASRGTTASAPSGSSSRAELIGALGVLRETQTKADLNGLARAYPRPDTIVRPRYSYEVDRPLARVVNIPAWRATVLVAPIRLQPSPISGQRPEGVHLSGWWTGDRFPLPGSLIGEGPPTSVGELLAHGLWGGPEVPGLDVAHGVVRGPDVEDGVLLVPDGVASVQLGRFTLSAQVAGLSTKALNATLARIHGTAAVHDNIAAFQLAIPVYAGRPPHWLGPGTGPGVHWPGPGQAPKFWFPAIGVTVQDTWFDASGHVVRRTTTEIGVTMRVQMAPAAYH